MRFLILLFMAVPSLVSAQNFYYDAFGNSVPVIVQQAPNVPIVNQNTYNGATTTTGVNPYTGQMWSNTIQQNGYTYGNDTSGRSYQGNVYQDPMTRTLNDLMIKGAMNGGAALGGAVGGSVYDSNNGE